MKTTINIDAAIKNDVIDFATALKLQGVGFDFDKAIKAEILDFSTALKLQGLAIENVGEVSDPAPKAKAPKAPKAKAPKQAKAEEPKAEEPEEPGFSYTKGGAVIQYADHNTLKANHLKRVNNAISRLEEVGFVVAWKRIGGWIHVYHYAQKDNMSRAEFEAALGILPKGWELHHGSRGKVSIVDKTMLADYADSFKA